MTKQKLYILCGFPFSGKTTIAKALEKKFGFTRITVDEINKERGIYVSSKKRISSEDWGKTFKIYYDRVANNLLAGKNVVCDSVAYTKQDRDDLKEIAYKYNTEPIVIFIDIPESIASQRWIENKSTNQRHDAHEEDFIEVISNFEKPQNDEKPLVYHQDIPLEKWMEENII